MREPAYEQSPPNKALHRTPAAAPLSPVSFQTFGQQVLGGGA